jgi:gamma-glutamyltranspeptidase/glutathione hydrolase
VRAGGEVAEQGGNAVDAAVATTIAALATEIGIVGLDAGAFISVWRPGEAPCVIDGGIAMPGRGRARERFGAAGRPVALDYGGGMETIVGYGAVGVGGAVAALGDAAAGWGRLEWPDLLAPAAARARQGFPLGAASGTWLNYSHREIFGWQPESGAVIHDAAGELLAVGAPMRVPGLAETLVELGRDGPAAFYTGRLGAEIAACVDAGGGLMSVADRVAYRVARREPMHCDVGDWEVAVPPPPAIGGAALAAMLARMGTEPRDAWSAASVAQLAAAQRDVFERIQDLSAHAGAEADAALQALVRWAASGGGATGGSAPSTVHISTLDADGLACAVTASSGYGSGVLVPGTGIWLNNCLGELELNPRGFHALAPGARMGSNMSPVVARCADGAMLSLGSPGAERITTALLQVMLNFMRLGLSLEEALAAPRLHVERTAAGWQAALEPGLPVAQVPMPVRAFDALSMFFGGAGAVLREADRTLVAAADPRRQGAALVVPAA